MQYTNDDMEEVFRRAGVDYPLNTTGADWSKVANALQENDPPPSPPPKKNYRHYRWLLLLLLIPWVCNYITDNQDETRVTSGNQYLKSTNTPYNNQDGVSDNSSLNTDSGTPVAETGKENDEPPGSSLQTAKSGIRENEKGIKNRNESASPISVNQVNVRNAGQRKRSKPSSVQNHNSNTGQLAINSDKQNLTDQETSEKQTELVKDDVKQEQDLSSSGKEERVEKDESEKETILENKAVEDLISAHDTSEIESSPAKEGKENDVVDSLVVSEKTITNPTDQNKKFYVGIMGGTGITSVKSQRVEQQGYEYGIVLGYNLNERISIEGGFLSSRKHYYSDGKHLDNNKIILPPNTIITDVTGDCRMWEIPVVARYNFSPGKTAGWFVSAGVSNFLMKQEDYDYIYQYGAGTPGVLHSYTYKNESKNWLAVMQVSGGFRFPLIKLFDARAEPYVQIPLRGSGYGNLPLTSAGLKLVITKSIW